jgi:hypothetical protein
VLQLTFSVASIEQFVLKQPEMNCNSEGKPLFTLLEMIEAVALKQFFRFMF